MSIVTYLMLTLFIFVTSIIGIIQNKNNILLVIMAVELALLAVNFNLLLACSYLNDRFGHILTIFILTIAAAETSVGLAILIVFFRSRGSISLGFNSYLNG